MSGCTSECMDGRASPEGSGGGGGVGEEAVTIG